MDQLSTNILLTDQHILKWEEERRQIEARLAEKKKELNHIDRMLSAAYLFDPSRRKEVTVEPQSSLSERIALLVSTSQEFLSARQIKKQLKASGYSNPSLDGGYYYKILKNLVKEGHLTEMNGEYGAVGFLSKDDRQRPAGSTGALKRRGRAPGEMMEVILKTLREASGPVVKSDLRAKVEEQACDHPGLKMEKFQLTISSLKHRKQIIETQEGLVLAEHFQAGQFKPEVPAQAPARLGADSQAEASLTDVILNTLSIGHSTRPSTLLNIARKKTSRNDLDEYLLGDVLDQLYLQGKISVTPQGLRLVSDSH